jgi:hypothetical protein
MSDKSTVNQGQCDKYREDLYQDFKTADQGMADRLKTLEDKVASMEGEKKFARYITPIIVMIMMAGGGFALNSIIKNTVRDAVKHEIKGLQERPETSMLISKFP